MPPLNSPPDDPAAEARARFLGLVDGYLRRFGRTGRMLVVLLLAITGIGLPIALGVAWGLRRSEEDRLMREALRAARAFGRRARAVIAVPLMVNRMLRAPGDEMAPGLVILSFDPSARPIHVMAGLAFALSSSGTEGDVAARWTDEQRKFAAELMADEEWQSFRRRKIPGQMTGGPTVYAFDLMIAPGLLPGGFLRDDNVFLPCLAEPGDSGRLLLLPYWITHPFDAPMTAEQTDEFLASLIHFEAFRRAVRSTGKDARRSG